MPIRMSGLVSNMDTESIIKELMSAQSLKKTKIENKITTLQWKQDKWKDLNSKLYSFYTGPLSKLKMQGNYNTLKATSSDETKVTVKASNSAPAGTHTLKIEQLASGQYVTSNALDSTVTNSTKLSALGFKTNVNPADTNADEGITMTIKCGTKTAYIDVGATTTVKDFTDACKDAGLNATYDTTQHRFFISSKESGAANAFYMTAASSDQTKQRNIIRDSIDYANMSLSQRDTVDSALRTYVDLVSSGGDTSKAKDTILSAYDGRVRAKYVTDYKAVSQNVTDATTNLTSELGRTPTAAELSDRLDTNASKAADNEYSAWQSNPSVANNVFTTAATKIDNLLSSYASASSTETSKPDSYDTLKLSEITRTSATDPTAIVSKPTNIQYVASSDSKIILDNAELNGTSNTMTVNGMTLNLNGLSEKTVTTTNGTPPVTTTDYKAVNFTVTKDSQAAYDMVKSFIKSYNEVLTAMNTAYDATKAKGYEPLTDDQKEAMTDTEIEKWETKIKDSLLRRDTTLNTIISTMRTDLSKSVAIDGKNYSLSSFGIGSANYSENGLLHINGDSDDSLVADQEDKLMAALNSDPEKVTQVISQLTSKLYTDLTDKMNSTTLRSALTFYNDKEMKKQVTDYKSDLEKLEDKLEDIEDRYYKQFTAMEKAMATMNSQSSSLTSMLGQ